MKRLLRRLTSRRGFSFTETLMAVAVMSILFTIIAMGVDFAVRVNYSSVALSDSQTLASTLTNALEYELHYARNMSTDSGELTFDSEVFGPGVSLTDEDGRLLIGGQKLLSDDVYGSELDAVVNMLVYDPATGFFDLIYTISGPDIQPKTVTLKIRALNG